MQRFESCFALLPLCIALGCSSGTPASSDRVDAGSAPEGSASPEAAIDASSDGGDWSLADAGLDRGDSSVVDAVSDRGDSSVTPGPSDGAADGTGDDGSAIVTDITQSTECAAYCAKASACGTCTPAVDCAIPAGSCALAERAYLQCKANTGSFVCGTSGWAVVSNCRRDTSVCPQPPPPDSGTCPLALSDNNCLGCLSGQCTTQYNALLNASDTYAFGNCIRQCEMACMVPYMCPDACSANAVSYAAYVSLVACGKSVCPQVCTPTTVIF
jgi:hypothetical protein